MMPGITQGALFDPVFFTSIPSHAFIYAVPYAWYEKYPQSRVKVFIIPPNEELMIAEDTFAQTTGCA